MRYHKLSEADKAKVTADVGTGKAVIQGPDSEVVYVGAVTETLATVVTPAKQPDLSPAKPAFKKKSK